MEEKFNNTTHFKPIIPEHNEWPVVKLSKQRQEFIERVSKESISSIKRIKNTEASLIEELERTRYKEKLRIQKAPWSVDPDDDYDFWKETI